jgi:hypothetical protein
VNRRIAISLFALGAIFSGAAFAVNTTTTVITSISPAPSLLGQAVTIKGTVSNGGAGGSMLGTVSFFTGAIQLGSVPFTGTNGSGNFTFSTILLPASTKVSASTNQLDVYAVYTGDSANGPSTSAVAHQTVNAKPGKGFDPGPNNPTVSSPQGAALGDFDGDGLMDLAVASASAGQISILLGNGDGSFHQANSSPISIANRGQIATVDFDEDGKLDLVVLVSGGAAVFHGNGDGTFGSGQSLAISTTAPTPETGGDTADFLISSETALVTGDFNGDGHIDVWIASSLQWTLLNGFTFDGYLDDARFFFFAGTGSGFSAPAGVTMLSARTISPVSPIGSGTAIAGLFHGGSNLDVLVQLSLSGSNSLYLLAGNGAGLFGNSGSLPGAPQPLFTPMAAGDFNADGKLDFAYLDTTGNLVVAKGANNGTFSFTPTNATDSKVATVATGDFNGDGFPDVVFAQSDQSNVQIYLGKGDGTFASPTTVATGSVPIFTVVADFNGDNRADLAVAAQSGNAISILLGAGPVITSISPTNVPAGAVNQTLTINGTDFASGDTVTWKPSAGSGQSLTGVTFVSSNQLTVPIPNALLSSAGTATVTVSDPTVNGLVSNGATFTINPPPTLTAISPTLVAAGGTGFTLTLTGTSLVSGDTVVWTPAGGSPTTFTNTTASGGGTTLTVPITSTNGLLNTPGQVTILVQDTASGVSTASQTLTIQPAPSISSANPVSVIAGSGQFTLTLTGTNFVNGDKVTWVPSAGGSTQQFTGTVSGNTSISVTVPAIQTNAIDTNVQIMVTDVDGAQSNAFKFQVLGPVISSVDPTALGTGTGNFVLTVNGSNFLSGSTVTFNGPGGSQNLTPSSVTATQLQVNVPGSLVGSGAGTAQVTVVNPGGATSSPVSIPIAPPAITGVTPPGATTGGTNALNITVNGSGFAPAAKVMWCNNCGSSPSALTTTFVNSSQLTAIIPLSDLSTVGTAQITVANDSANPTNPATTSNSVNFSISSLIVNSLSPSFALAGGPKFNLTISGQNFSTSGATVLWGNQPPLTSNTFTSSTPTTIVVPIPASYIANPGQIAVSVLNPEGSVSPPVNFTVGQLAITGVTPFPLIAGANGITLTVTGQNFDSTTQIQWNAGTTTTLASQFISSTQMTAVVPANLLVQAGSALLTALNTSYNVTSAPFQVTINGPSITTVSPATAGVNVPSFALQVTGLNFLSGSTVLWNNGLGQATPLPTTFVNSQSLTAIVPASLLTTAGTALITVQNPGNGSTGAISNGVTFSVGPAPTIKTDGTGLSPNGATAGSAAFSLSVAGTNFQSGANVLWTENGVSTTLQTAFVNPASVTANVPASLIASPGTALISVENPGGILSNALLFTVGPGLTPTITSLSPAAGITAGSATFQLTVTGTNFAAGSVVQWNGGSTPQNLSTIFVSSTQLTAVVPASLVAIVGTALVNVLNPGGGTSNSVAFPITTAPAPAITALSQTSVAAGGPALLLSITGSNFTPTSVGQWNAGAGPQALATQYLGPTQLSVVIPPAMTATGGVAFINVLNTANVVSNSVQFTVNAEPSITANGLTPSSVTAGGPAFQLLIAGSNFVSGALAQWDTGSGPQALSTSFLNSGQVAAVIPASLIANPGTAFVSVQNPSGGGSGASSNVVAFTINPAPASPTPTIAASGGLNPASAVAGGNAFQIIITGTNFLSTSQVVWTNGTPTNLATTFVNGTQLVAQVPSTLIPTAGTALITVRNPGNANSNGVTFTINPTPPPTPTISTTGGVTPSSATVGGPAFQIVVAGTNFIASSIVQWNSGTAVTPLATVYVNATQLTALVPASLIAGAGTAFISVQNPGGGTSNLATFNINPPGALPNPTINTAGGLQPSSAVAGGAALQMVVNGTNFISTSIVQWNAGSGPQALTTTYLNANTLSALVPANLIATVGTAFVSVQNSASSSSNLVPFTINAQAAPTINSNGGLLPASAVAGGAQFQLAVNGANFVSGSTVQWNSGNGAQALTTQFVNSSTLTALVPASLIATSGTVFVSVTNPGNGTSNVVTFTIAPAAGPQIGAVSPASGTAGSAGATLTITGSGFVNGSIVNWNSGAGAQALTTGFVSATELTALVTAAQLASPGTALISVTNPDKSVSNSVQFSVTGQVVGVPTVSSISPTSAPAGSPALTLTVSGTNFLAGAGSSSGSGSSGSAPSGSVVQWNGTALPTTFVSSTQLTAQVSATLLQAAGTNFVNVANPGNLSSGGTTFTVAGATLTAIAPATATAGSGAFTLTLTGTNFVTGATAVWNSTTLATTVNSATQLTALVPANLIATAGTAFVLVTSPGGSTTSPQLFTVSAPSAPTITSLNPASAVAGGAAFQLSVTGAGFMNGAVVLWNGSTLATGFVSATQVTAFIDSSLISSAGIANVSVQNPGSPVSATVKLNINGPTITTLNPNSANAGDPGFNMTVTGTNFVPGSSVVWNGTPLPTSYVSATQIMASVPASSIAVSTSASVTVQNPGGAISPSSPFTVGAPSLVIHTSSLPDAVVGAFYSQTLSASGGTQPYTWTLTSGSAPAGLALAPGGTLSGTPSGASNVVLGVTVTDAQKRTATTTLTLNTVLALLVTTNSPLTTGTVGTAYSQVLAATGGTPPYLWSASGALPPGLALNVATGEISGLPTAPGGFNFTVTVSDARGQQTATKTFSAVMTISNFSLGGPPTNIGPAQQVPVTVSVGTPYAVDLNGSLTISFASAVGGDDPSIQFNTGGRTVSFTIPAGSTNAVFGQNQQLLLSTGTVAGAITVKATVKAGAADITPSPAPQLVTNVQKQAPVITSVTLKKVTGGVQLSIAGYTTTKEATQAVVLFNPAPGASLNTSTINVPLASTLSTWYQSAAAANFGSQFVVTIPFTITGDINAIGSATVTVTNSVGTSAAVTGALQ